MNYLPFVRRAMLTLPTSPARRSVTIPAMSAGKGRTILQDFEVIVSGAVNVYEPNDTVPVGQTARALVKMRYGWERKGFLTEEFHPCGAFLNRGRPLVPVWKFARPYQLNPGESIKASLAAGGGYNISAMPAESTPALVFNCVRTRDNQPKLLYDVSRTVDTTGTVVSLSMDCDSDSSLLLYGAALHDWYEFNAIGNPATFPQASYFQIFGPGGREWFHLESATTLTVPQYNVFRGGWFEFSTDYTHLGEENGWIMDPGEAFVVELSQTESGTADKLVGVTLRGCFERPND